MRSLSACVALAAFAVVGCAGSEFDGSTSGSSDASGPGSGASGPGSGGSGTGATGGDGGAGATGAGSSSGGSSTGGSSTGGSSSGGSSSGGSSTGGAGGGGGMGVGGGGSAMPQCTDASQCTLVNDCCTCAALAPGEQAPPCNIQCIIPKCTELGVPNPVADCVVGQCVAGFPCDHNAVACESLPPNCPPGETASVNGLCWGPCVDAAECGKVGGCGQCSGGQGCVTEVTQLGPIAHCVDIDPACGNVLTCACMGPAVCVGSFDTCAEANGELQCSCPNC